AVGVVLRTPPTGPPSAVDSPPRGGPAPAPRASKPAAGSAPLFRGHLRSGPSPARQAKPGKPLIPPPPPAERGGGRDHSQGGRRPRRRGGGRRRGPWPARA